MPVDLRALLDSLALAASLSLLACGGGSESEGECSTFASCGGDPLGSWRAELECTPPDYTQRLVANSGFAPECLPGVRINSITPNTTLELTPEGTFAETGSVVLDWSFHMDSSCASAGAEQPITAAQIPAFCAAFEQALRAEPENPFDGLSCDSAGGACDCDATQEEPVDAAGSFEVRDASLVFADGSSEDFCVRGDTLRLQPEADMFGSIVLVYRRN